MSEYLPLLVAGPLAAAALVVALHRFVGRTVIDLLALATALAVAAFAAAIMLAAGDGPVVVWAGGWTPREGATIGIGLAADVLGSGFALLIALLVTVVLVFSRLYFHELGGLFQSILLVFLGAAAGYCITADLFNLYVFFELIGVSAFVLTAYRMEENALHGAFAFAVINSLAGFLVLAGIGVLYATTGTVNLAEIGLALARLGDSAAVRLAFVLILTGFLIKAAAVPFHFWLADAYAGAAAPVCILFGGASVTLGIFGAARVLWTVFSGSIPSDLITSVLVPAGILTALYAPVMALVEPNLKRVLALTTVSHVGVLLVAIGLMSFEGVAGAANYLLGHALIKAGLFAAAGILIARFGFVDTERLGRRPGVLLPVVILAAGGLMLAGLPPSAAHTGKSMVHHAVEAADVAWTAPLLTLASSLSGAAVLLCAGRLVLGTAPEPRAKHTRTPAVAMAGIAVLLLGAGAGSALPEVAATIESGAATFTSPQAFAAAVLEGARTGVVPPDLEREFSLGLDAFTAPLGAVAVAALMLWRDRAPGLVRAPMSLVVSAALMLHRLHTGHVGDYVAWLMAGLCALGAATAILSP